MRLPDTGLGGGRLAVVRTLLLLVFVALAARAAHLSVIEQRGARRGVAQTQRTLELAPERGIIFDRSRVELALSVDAPSIYALASVRDDWRGSAQKLAPLLGMPEASLEQRLRERRSFGFLARWVAPNTAEKVRALDLPGVGVLEEPRRVYPHRALGASILGFSNIDGIGVRGLEQREDDWLRGSARRVPVERDAAGRLLMGALDEPWNTSGGDLALSIDAHMQADAESALAEAVERSGARGGVVVSMDPRTGDILALAEAPGFDPNRFREFDFASTRSRAFLDAAEPGSTLKAFLIAGALESGSIATDELFDCEEGAFRVPGKTIRDHRPHGLLSVADILRVSSNIGAVKIAYQIGRRTHYNMLRGFGFGEVTRSGFPEESTGLLRSWMRWGALDHATIAYGHGINVTPVQLARALAALANGGMLVEPRLVTARRPPGGEWQATPVQVTRRVVSEQTASTVMSMLAGVVSHDGTGRDAGLRGVSVAGKTGTAQKWEAEKHRYSSQRFVAWFMGAVPADHPRIVIVAALDEPARPAHTGGASAAPLFARVAAAQLTEFGIHTVPQRPVAPRVEAAEVLIAEVETPERIEMPIPAAAEAAFEPPSAAAPALAAAPRKLPEIERLGGSIFLPDLTGLSVAEVRKITAGDALTVEITGSGWVVSQDPSPGTVLQRDGQPLRLRLSNGARNRSTLGREG